MNPNSLRKSSIRKFSDLPQETVDDIIIEDSIDNIKKPSQTEAIKTFCRIRPIDNPNELFKVKEDDTRTLQIITENVKKLNLNMNSTQVNSYTFSKTFDESSSQTEVFEVTCKALVNDLVKKKKSGLIFTYGMTNAGKTFTVIGSNTNPGILPLSLKYLYSCISESEQLSVYCNFVEIYNEEVFDLLANDPKGKNKFYKKKLIVKENNRNLFYIADVTQTKLTNLDEFANVLNKGVAKKTHAVTNLNQNSSRSHTIFKIILKQTEEEQDEISLSIVDLAGSERSNRTETQGKELQEACKINQSLSILGKCMEALKYNSTYINKRLVPFRESKLTKIFQEYFQGDQNIIMITNINPRKEDFEETLRALNYSCIAKEIKPIKSRIVINPMRKRIKIAENNSGKLEVDETKFNTIPDETMITTRNDSSSNVPTSEFDLSYLKSEMEKLKQEVFMLKNSSNFQFQQRDTNHSNSLVPPFPNQNSEVSMIQPYTMFNNFVPFNLFPSCQLEESIKLDLDVIPPNMNTFNLVFVNSKFNDIHMGPKKRQKKLKKLDEIASAQEVEIKEVKEMITEEEEGSEVIKKEAHLKVKGKPKKKKQRTRHRKKNEDGPNKERVTFDLN